MWFISQTTTTFPIIVKSINSFDQTGPNIHNALNSIQMKLIPCKGFLSSLVEQRKSEINWLRSEFVRLFVIKKRCMLCMSKSKYAGKKIKNIK